MTDPFIDQAHAMAVLSAENGLLRAKIERLQAALNKIKRASCGDEAYEIAKEALEQEVMK